MKSMNAAIDRSNLRVRPNFVFACVVFLLVFFLPDIISGKHGLQKILLLLASVSIAVGWFFLLKPREPNSKLRALVALASSVYLTASLPAFLFELSQIKWLMRHPLHHTFEMYVWPWVHWGYHGYVPVLLGVAGSFAGRGRARTAFVVGSILLLILRESMGTWVL
ncbi:MAG TPA: hypothetical protein VK763_07650 [Terriglobales bacterium]|jgi:hypothetical protein|nr:hypothetical protein [Terriglobales bacterium]